MREIRTSGSEGGGAGYSTGPPYPYPTLVPSGTAISFFPCPVGTIEGSQVISIPGAIGVVVNHF